MSILKSIDFHNLRCINDVFIETGTFRAETLQGALEAGFEEIHSIDIVEEYVQNAVRQFKDHLHVHLHHGSSPDVLPHIIDSNKTTTFWLDAHYQAFKDYEIDTKYGECPLLAELSVIFTFSWAIPPIILIDDPHMFGQEQPNFKFADWPQFDNIHDALPAYYTLKQVKVSDSNDILVCHGA